VNVAICSANELLAALGRMENALAFDLASFPSYGRVDVLSGRGNAWKALPTQKAALHN
jgi:hypothetical protein